MSTLRNLRLAAVAAMVLAPFAIPAMAHQGHHHPPITKEVAIERGTLHIEKLVAAGKLDGSWKVRATLQSADLRQNGDHKEWALVYANPEAKPGERTLYLVLNENGKYLSGGFKET